MLLIDQLALMSLLAVAGDPLRRLISGKVGVLQTLDMFQIALLDFYLGGIVFYVIALFPFGLFTSTITFIVLVVAFVITTTSIVKKHLLGVRRSDLHVIRRIRQLPCCINEILMGTAVILIFLTVFWFEAEASVGVLFGNVHDASLFSMISTAISQNGMIPATLKPFDSSGIVYPQAYAVILTFATYVFHSGPETTILVLVPLFQALGTIGAYFLGKMWSGKMVWGVVFAFIFGFVSRWPKLLVWGSYAFVAAFPLYLIVFGLITLSTRRMEEKKQDDIFELFFLGLIIGYLGAIHAVYYEVIIATLFIVALEQIYRRKRDSLRGPILSSFTVFVLSLLPVCVFLYRFAVSLFLPGQNIGLPDDVVALRLPTLIDNLGTFSGSFFISDWISPYPILRIAILILIGLAFATVFIAKKRGWHNNDMSHPIALTLFSLLGVGLIVLVGSREIGFSLLASAINIPETAIVMFVSLMILVGTAIVTLNENILTRLNNRLSKTRSFGLIILIFMLSFSPFIYYTLTSDAEYCRGVYNFLAVTTPQDYALMLNMKNTLPENSTILINPYDAGGFIPSIAGYKVVYPFTGSRNSISYSSLYSLVLERNLNQSAYDLLSRFNITYIFVGAKATEYVGPSAWDPSLFLGNPNFKLIQRVGDSYLFAFNPKNPSIVFFDDFERLDLRANGWEVITSGNTEAFTISLSRDIQHKFDGNQSLLLKSKASSNSTSLVWLQRKILLPESNRNVEFSFYVDSDAVFKDFEGLTLIVSDASWERQLLMSTWNRGDNDRPLVSPGFYEIDLSSLWSARFNVSLPNSFTLQVELYDSDGIEESFFLDSVGIALR